MTLSLILASCLLGVSAAALVLWLCERHRKRREDAAWVDAFIARGRADRLRRNRRGQFRPTHYGKFSVNKITTNK